MSWKKYGGLNNHEKGSDITTNSIISDTISAVLSGSWAPYDDFCNFNFNANGSCIVWNTATTTWDTETNLWNCY